MSPKSQSESPLEQPGPNDGFWLPIIYIVSFLVCGAVMFLILGPRPANLEGQLDVSALPLVNCLLNGTAFCLLIAGGVLIKQRRIELHKRFMLAAFATSAAFLVTYIVYHWFKAGPQQYTGDYRGLYLTILLTHIVLAASIIPLALVTLYRGWTNQLARHRKIAVITYPIWLYVSVTGVVIYLMLY
jgi:putative membrane protein